MKICNSVFDEKSIIEIESHILLVLQFDLVFCSSYNFFEMFSKHLNVSQIVYNMGLFMLNLCLLEFHMNKYKPSILALAVCY